MKPKRRQVAGRVRRIVLGTGWRVASSDARDDYVLSEPDLLDSRFTVTIPLYAERFYSGSYGEARRCRLVLEVLPKQQPKRKAAAR